MKNRVIARFKAAQDDYELSDAVDGAYAEAEAEVSPTVDDILRFAKEGILAGCKKKGEQTESFSSRRMSGSASLDWAEVEVRTSKTGLEVVFPYVMTESGNERSKPEFEIKVRRTD